MVPSILHTSKFRLEARYRRIWIGNMIGRVEVEIALIPLPRDIDDVIELWMLRRWLDVLRLQDCFDQFIGLRCDLCFHGVWHPSSGQLRARGARHPRRLSLCHAFFLLTRMASSISSVKCHLANKLRVSLRLPSPR